MIVNAIHRDWGLCHWMVKDLFGPFEPDEMVIEFGDDMTLDRLAFIAGVFPSMSQARKSSYGGKPVPAGWSEHRMGKNWHNARKVYVLGKPIGGVCPAPQ